MIYHNIEQGTSEWFEIRRGKFTASVFANLFMKENTAGYLNTIYQAVYERLTNDIPESFSNDWMIRGKELEPEARERYEFETFNKVHEVGFVEHSEFIGCSPDGLIGEDGLVEIKCPKFTTMIGYLLDKKLPRIYEWQIQGQLYVTDRKWCDFFAYHPKLKPLLITVKRDEKKIEELKEKLTDSILKVKQILEKLNG